MLYLNRTIARCSIGDRAASKPRGGAVRRRARRRRGRGRRCAGGRSPIFIIYYPMGVASEASAIRSGVRFSVAARGPLRRVPGPGTPAALPARHTATALTPPQPSWMRSRCPAVRTLHYAEPMRCCDLPRCLHSQAHVYPSHGLATPSHRRVQKATPRCPATCLTSRARARTQLPDKSACGSLAFPYAATANPLTPRPTRTSCWQHGIHSARRGMRDVPHDCTPCAPSQLAPGGPSASKYSAAEEAHLPLVLVYLGRREPIGCPVG